MIVYFGDTKYVSKKAEFLSDLIDQLVKLPSFADFYDKNGSVPELKWNVIISLDGTLVDYAPDMSLAKAHEIEFFVQLSGG